MAGLASPWGPSMAPFLSFWQPRPVAGEHLGVIEIPPPIEDKIRRRHDITGLQVREALQWPAKAETAWENSDEHGRRLVAVGQAASGRLVIAWLLPLPEWDENSDTWTLKTSRWV